VTDALARICGALAGLPAGLVIGIMLLAGAEWVEAGGGEPPAALVAAEQVYRTAGPEVALPEFQRLADEYRENGDRLSEAAAIRFVGEIHWRLGDFEKAETFLQLALAAATEADDPAQQARVLNAMGLLQWDLGDYEQALAYFRRAGVLAAEVGDIRLQGAVLNNSSLVHDERGEYFISLDTYRQALALYDAADFPRGRADTLGNIGGVHLLLGQYAEALDYYRQALAISEALGSVTSSSQDHGNIALCHLGLGDTALALQHFNRAIALAEQAGAQQDLAYWTRGKANALIRQGRLDQGLEYHRKAVAQYQALGARTDAIEAMYDLGRLHLALGDSASAGQWFDDSLRLAREIGLQRGVTLNLLALGDLQLRRQANEAAAALYAQAMQRAREAGEQMLAAEGLLRLSIANEAQAQYDIAALHALEALDIARSVASPWVAAEALQHLGDLDRLRGDPVAALANYRAAEAALPEVADPDLGWRIHHGAGLALAAQDELSAAIAELQRAVAYIESVRDRLEEQRFRAGYVQDKYQVYVDLVRLQMQAGAENEAFSTAERLRARSYLDLFDEEAPIRLTADERQQVVELRERIRQLRRAFNEETTLPGTQQRQPAVTVYSTELLSAERQYETLLDTARRRVSRSRAADDHSHHRVSERLARGEALVEYLVAGEDVLIFVVDRDGLQALTSPVGQADLLSRVELLRDLLRRPDSNRWQRPAAGLAAALVEPLQAAGALAGIHHLYLVPYGSLNYLPFAMLPSSGGDRLLVEDYTLAYLPTAAALPGDGRPQQGQRNMLAMAPARSRLRHAPEEASRVFELFGAESRLLLGEAATESLFKQVAGDFDVLHLATHGYFNKLNPLLSGLELEADDDNDGLLELHEIVGLDLDARLVTLSACETGLGSGHFAEIPPGDDFVGLTRAFLAAGSDAVLATLWEVDDASTAELMQQFYVRMRFSAETPAGAAALAEAQRRLLASELYRHPYYWAPFVLVGTNRPPLGQTPGVGR
jgi:CHAT domain-containing protein/Tfp pilus assembly protein PilF